jgi:DNA mismatch repair protein MutS2
LVSSIDGGSRELSQGARVTEALLDKTLSDLEWHKLEAQVAAHLRGPAGASFSLPLAATREAAAQGLAETAEALALLRQGEPLPLDGVRAIDTHLLRVERHGDLDVVATNEVRLTLGAARVLRRFLGARKLVLPALTAACPIDPSLDRLFDTLSQAFDADGTLADHASPELKRLRIETRNLRAHVIARLEELVHKHAELLSDRFYTLREGRYVLPVRSDAHERVHGIVHGTSASGSTIFVEPRSLVMSGNRLKLAEAEQEREEQRILAALSEEIRVSLASVRAAYEALLHADLKSASARLAEQLGLTRPVLLDEPEIQLRGARHPVLLIDGASVVANDVEAAAARALVISGPNAGGKTVALKLLGLSALMLRAGLFLPTDEGSRCGFFDAVLSDIGDEQSLSKNLSTFSAHIDHIRQILEVAGRGSLVLLDELAGSTDPEEGAALACAIVERLCEQGAAVAVTTHYEPLKARALSDPRMRNASVGFDVAGMAPTFKLRLDVPGASSALAVAERFGLARAVVERARQVVPDQSKHFDALVQQLSAKLGEADARSAELARDLERARDVRRLLEADLERQQARDKRALGGEAQQLLAELKEMRGELERLKKQLRQARLSADDVREAGRRVDQLAASAREHPAVRAAALGESVQDERPELAPDALAVGARVYVPRLRAEVEIVEAPSKGRARVAAGPMRLWVDVSELRARAPAVEQGKQERAKERSARRDPAPERPTTRGADNGIDLRGMRVDDALSLLDAFLDRMYGRGESVAFVEHGFGTGALREAVRSHLARPSPYVQSVRPGSPDEGGERVTVVMLR